MCCCGLMRPRLNFLAVFLKAAETTPRITERTPRPWQSTVVAPSCSWASARKLKMKFVGWPEEGAAQGWQIRSSFCKQKKFGLSDSCMKWGYCNPSQNFGDLIVIIQSLNGSQSFALLQTELVFPDVPSALLHSACLTDEVLHRAVSLEIIQKMSCCFGPGPSPSAFSSPSFTCRYTCHHWMCSFDTNCT